MDDNLKKYIIGLDTDEILPDRKATLEAMIDYVRSSTEKGGVAKLNFICTHNSRRSQIAQVWAQVAAVYHGVSAMCYSGGVEVTEFNDRAVEALRRTGLNLVKRGDENPTYLVLHGESYPPIVTYSKLYDDAINPTSDFAAIMTCDHADKNCPFIPGTMARIPVRYLDPNISDDTPSESTTYDLRVRQIAIEMMYVFGRI